MLEHGEIPMIDTHTGVPFAIWPETTENEEIERRLEEMIRSSANIPPDNANTPSPVPWPTVGERPLNEFTTEGYIAMAFPTLFPKGDADLQDAINRRDEVKIAEYFKSLLTYKDGRFGSHPRYVSLWPIEIDVKIRFLRIKHKATCRGTAGSTIIYKDGSWRCGPDG